MTWHRPEGYTSPNRRSVERKRLREKGVKGGFSPRAYLGQITRVRKWQKEHKEQRNATQRRYEHKLAAEAGGWSRYKIAEALRKRLERRLDDGS